MRGLHRSRRDDRALMRISFVRLDVGWPNVLAEGATRSRYRLGNDRRCYRRHCHLQRACDFAFEASSRLCERSNPQFPQATHGCYGPNFCQTQARAPRQHIITKGITRQRKQSISSVTPSHPSTLPWREHIDAADCWRAVRCGQFVGGAYFCRLLSGEPLPVFGFASGDS